MQSGAFRDQTTGREKPHESGPLASEKVKKNIRVYLKLGRRLSKIVQDGELSR